MYIIIIYVWSVLIVHFLMFRLSMSMIIDVDFLCSFILTPVSTVHYFIVIGLNMFVKGAISCCIISTLIAIISDAVVY